MLEAQVRRMLADPRADALVENFVGQWLQLRNLESRVKPDFLLFPDFDDNLRKGFRRETELLFANVLREGRRVHELIDANYTFVNERLARHYGIKGVYGARFRKVDVTDPNRYGLFGHGSLLALTSASSRTSPIIRGKFIVTEFWNNPPPPPPADVPALEESAPKDRPSTVREQLELHRANPVCAACHNNIDPVGFALENFDVDGSWRERRARASRSTRPASCRRHAGRRPRRAARGAAGRSGALREHRHGEDADLRARPRSRAGRHAGRPANREKCGRARLQPCRLSSWV